MSALIAFGATVAMAQTSGTRALGPLSSEEGHRAPCRATGTICFLGIDPDIYHMPLYGEYIQSGDRLICATRNWSSFPPEAFSIDFLRHFSTQMTSQGKSMVVIHPVNEISRCSRRHSSFTASLVFDLTSKKGGGHAAPHVIPDNVASRIDSEGACHGRSRVMDRGVGLSGFDKTA